MRYSAELAARAQAWLGREAYATGPEGKRSAEGLLELATVWAAIQNVPLPACIRQCQYLERARDVAAYVREYQQFSTSSAAMSDTQTAPTYQFKPDYVGQTLTADDYSKAVTQDNLTDEDAEHCIKKGFGHVFQKIGAAVAGAGEKPEGASDNLAGDEDNDEPTEREQELQGEVDKLNQKLSDQTNSYNAAYAQATANLTEYQKNYGQAIDSLKAEQTAHTTTKQQLSEVQQQLAEAQATITKLKAKGKPTAPGGAPTASATPVASADAAPISSPAAGTDASADAATGSN